MRKPANKFSAEMRERAVRLVLDNEGQHPSRWQAIISIASKIGCAPQTLNEWVKKAEVDSGQRPGNPGAVHQKLLPAGWSGLRWRASRPMFAARRFLWDRLILKDS